MQPRLTIAIFLALVLALATTPTRAQESSLGPPPALEFPFQAKPEAKKGVSMAILRSLIEDAADFSLCTTLMKHDGKVSPPDAQGNATCLPEYAKKVDNNEGFIQWAPNARPLKCKTCFGRPFNNPERNTLQPNLRRATIFGRLAFMSVSGPNRSITFPYQVHFTCKAPNGARDGNLVADLVFDPAIIGEPGFWENLGSFFSVGELTRLVDARIKRELSPLGSLRTFQGPCLSVGTVLGNDPITDIVKFDPPVAPKPFVVATVTDKATIKLLRIKRNPLPPGVSNDFARPGAIEAGQFTLFTNGVIRALPPAGLTLPPAGGSVPLNFCKSVGLQGANRLQLMFVNDLGGAVWSEFQRPAKFGDGPTRTMTTGRTILVPATSGLPGATPQPVPLREFELTYRITFTPRPVITSSVAATKPKPVPASTTKGRGPPCVEL